MIKIYCDRCESQIPAAKQGRIKFSDNDLDVEIMTGWDGVWNEGHFCHACIFDAIKRQGSSIPLQEQRGAE